MTVPAHQALVLPIKLRWPDRTDATAMCIAAAAPDLGYPILRGQSHSLIGVVVFAIPFTLLACWLLRRHAALVIFGNLPDAGPFRIHSYRVLTQRHPGTRITLMSAAIGAISHVFLDAFTHEDRWGARWLGLDRVLITVPIRGDMTGARVLQYVGHTVGSLIAVALFFHIGRRRLLERWYGADAVAGARTFTISPGERRVFWSVLAGITAVLTPVLIVTGGTPAFSAILATTIGVLVAGSIRWRPAQARAAA